MRNLNQLVRAVGFAAVIAIPAMTSAGSANAQGMSGMQGMGGMQGMSGMQGMGGMQGMTGMQGAPQLGPFAIDSADAARKAADAWLQAVDGQGLKVGKIREINEIFVISIVFERDTKKLRDQLIIRKPDGFAFPIFPMGVPGQEPPGGMSGMSGMGGMQ